MSMPKCRIGPFEVAAIGLGCGAAGRCLRAGGYTPGEP
jgi:hypothetical protein